MEALNAIAKEQPFDPKLDVFGMSSIKTLDKDPNEALVKLLTEDGDFLNELFNHCSNDKKLIESLEEFITSYKEKTNYESSSLRF